MSTLFFRPLGALSGLALVLLALLAGGCAKRPLAPYHSPEIIHFSDDLSPDSLRQSLGRSLAYLHKLPAQREISIGERSYPVEHLIDSLTFFLQLLENTPAPEELNELIWENYDVVRVAGRSGREDKGGLLVTGYYQPVVEGSLQRRPPFIHPLYSPPADLVVKRDSAHKITSIGRMVAGQLEPYPTRRMLETTGLAAGCELVWLKDPLDAFFLHVQGSGVIRLRDGSLRGVHYAQSNGRPYRSIGRYLVTTGRMALAEVNMESIRDYVTAHPEEQQEILFHNDSYIFFQWREAPGAVGSINEVLTPGRSIAADPSCFPPGALAFLQTSCPIVKEKHLQGRTAVGRFVVVQDQGSAIKGAGRIDLFCGTGEAAGQLAGFMREEGEIYFLVLKEKRMSRGNFWPDKERP